MLILTVDNILCGMLKAVFPVLLVSTFNTGGYVAGVKTLMFKAVSCVAGVDLILKAVLLVSTFNIDGSVADVDFYC